MNESYWIELLVLNRYNWSDLTVREQYQYLSKNSSYFSK